MKNKKKIIAAVLLLIIFIINTILVVNGKYTNIDDSVHQSIYRIHSEFTNKLMHFITFFGSTKFMVLLAVCLFGIFLWKKRKYIAFSLVGNLIVSTLINNIIKLIIRRPRPLYITVNEPTFSYPSGHIMSKYFIIA